jgi:hypothetical protein
MYTGKLIKLKNAIFRRNSIFDPGFLIKLSSFHKIQSNSHKFEVFLRGVQNMHAVFRIFKKIIKVKKRCFLKKVKNVPF